MILNEAIDRKCWHSLTQGSGHKAPSPYVIHPCLATHTQASDLVLAHPIGPSAWFDGVGAFGAQGFKIAEVVTAVGGLRAGGLTHYGCSCCPHGAQKIHMASLGAFWRVPAKSRLRSDQFPALMVPDPSFNTIPAKQEAREPEPGGVSSARCPALLWNCSLPGFWEPVWKVT